MITLYHLWCVKTTRLQTEYVFGEQEKLQRGKSGKQGRQRAKNVLELVCAPPPQKKTPAAWMLHTDGSALNNSDEPQHENWISSTRKDALLQFQFVAQKEQTKNSIHAGRVHKDISLNGKLARFKSVAVFLMFRLFRNWCWNGIHKYINCCLI